MNRRDLEFIAVNEQLTNPNIDVCGVQDGDLVALCYIVSYTECQAFVEFYFLDRIFAEVEKI